MMMFMQGKQSTSEHALIRKLMPLAWGLLGLVGLLLGLMWGVLQVQLALAAFLNGESIWSKAQKQIVVDIQAYAVHGDPEALESFDRNFALLSYDRFARDESLKENYDYNAVVEALNHDNAMRDAIPVVEPVEGAFSDAIETARRAVACLCA